MTHDLLLKNGLIVTPSGAIRGGLAISGERIVGVGSEETLGGARREIDLQGKIVMPGLFDPHVHLGLSGDTFSDDAMATDFEFDTRECLVGGVTTIATTTLIGREPLPELFSRARKMRRVAQLVRLQGHMRGQHARPGQADSRGGKPGRRLLQVFHRLCRRAGRGLRHEQGGHKPGLLL